jgi:hypothetical protein
LKASLKRSIVASVSAVAVSIYCSLLMTGDGWLFAALTVMG